MTLPTNDTSQPAPRVVLAPAYRDDESGALYVHKDLIQVAPPWDTESHVGPPKASEAFGDVQSWAAYVHRFAGAAEFAPLLTWNARGLSAVLDYHQNTEDAGRRQWTATCPFKLSTEWRQWSALANGQPVSQKSAVERLEDLADDITLPGSADLMTILRSLRASVSANASSELRADGSTSVRFEQDKKVAGGGAVDLPAQIWIGIRVLAGDVDAAGKPLLYRIPVRLRVTVDDSAHLALRFSMPNAERVLEDAYASRVEAARNLLGGDMPILRAAD